MLLSRNSCRHEEKHSNSYLFSANFHVLLRFDSIKQGKIVILLQGKYAGKKCIVLQTNDQGTNKHSFGHCVVAGIEKYPRKVTKRMSSKKIAARSQITPFMKLVNYRHILPTRYSFDLGDEAKQAIDTSAFSAPASKEDNPEARKKSVYAVRKALEAKYKTGRSPWLFKPLAF